MAVFNKNSLYQISGFNNPIIAGELVWEQQTYWNLVFTNSVSTAPVSSSNSGLRREVSKGNCTCRCC